MKKNKRNMANKKSERKSNTESSIGKNERKLNKESSIGKNERKSNKESSIGKNERKSNKESSIGNNERKLNTESSIGKNERKSNTESSIGNNERKLNTESSIGNNERKSNTELSIGNNENTSNTELSIGNNERKLKNICEVENSEKCVMSKLNISSVQNIKNFKIKKCNIKVSGKYNIECKVEQYIFNICKFHGIECSKYTRKEFWLFYEEVISNLSYYDENIVKIYLYGFIFLDLHYKIKKKEFIRNEFSVKVFDNAIEKITEWKKTIKKVNETEDKMKQEKEESIYEYQDVCNLYSIVE